MIAQAFESMAAAVFAMPVLDPIASRGGYSFRGFRRPVEGIHFAVGDDEHSVTLTLYALVAKEGGGIG